MFCLNTKKSHYSSNISSIDSSSLMFCLNTKKIQFYKVLSEGDFGSFHPYHKSGQSDYHWIVKSVYAQHFEKVLDCMQEIALGFSCDHPSILPVKGYYIEKAQPKGWNVYMKYPRMQKSMHQKLEEIRVQKNKFFSEDEIIKYFHSLACGLEYLHEKKITHGNIDPKVILLDQLGEVKLSEIGRNSFVDKGRSVSSTLGIKESLYKTSEGDQNQKRTKKSLYKSDAWQLGVTIAELCLLKALPMLSSGSIDEKEAAINDLIDQISLKYSKNLAKIILGLLQCNADQRTRPDQVKRMLEENYGVLGINKRKIEKKEEQKVEEVRKPGVKTIGQTKNDRIMQKPQAKQKMGKEKRESSPVGDLEWLKTELDKKWREAFDLYVDRNTGELRVTGNPRWTDDSNLSNFMTDLNGKLEEKAIDNLKQLNLKFQNAKTTNPGFTVLGNQIGANFEKLEVLALDLNYCNTMNLAAIEDITRSAFPNLKSLRGLTIRLQWYF